MAGNSNSGRKPKPLVERLAKDGISFGSRTGPPPKPAALRLLHGNPSKRPIPREVSPEGKPVRPRRMAKDAGAHWDKNVKQLVSLGLATALDQSALEVMCDHWAAYQAAKRAGETSTQLKFFAAWEKLASKFGMTAADRARLAGITATTELAKSERFLA